MRCIRILIRPEPRFCTLDETRRSYDPRVSFSPGAGVMNHRLYYVII